MNETRVCKHHGEQEISKWKVTVWKDGKTHYVCKACRNAAVKRWKKNHPDAARAEGRKRAKIWRAKNPERARAFVRRFQASHERNKLKHNARELARRHIPLEGLCTKCGKNPAEHRHHEDYGQALDVQLLCCPCHMELARKHP
jgi:hypothetical protein